MPEDRQGTIARVNGKVYGDGTGGLGSANSENQGKCFASPLDDPGSIPLWEDYLSLTMRGNSDIEGTETWANRSFQDNLDADEVAMGEVETGGGGKPTSPWTPNLASPGMISMGSGDTPGVSWGVDYNVIPDLEWSSGSPPGFAGVQNSSPPGVGDGSLLGPNGTVAQKESSDISTTVPLVPGTDISVQQYPQNVGTDALGSRPSGDE